MGERGPDGKKRDRGRCIKEVGGCSSRVCNAREGHMESKAGSERRGGAGQAAPLAPRLASPAKRAR